MPRQAPKVPEIRVIHFTRRLERQCRLARPRVTELSVCDAIANGTRQAGGGRGTRGGILVRFKGLPAPESSPTGRLRSGLMVLAEVTPLGCFALQLLAPARGGEKSGMIWDF
jgi:hypothetical protein